MKKLMTCIFIISLNFVPVFSQVGTIKGKVVDSKNQPLGNVEIVFTQDENASYNQVIKTKENGSFVLTGLKPGKMYKATFNFEGYNTQVYPYKQWIGPNDEPIVITMYTLEEAYEQQGGNLESLAADQSARQFYNIAVEFFKQKKFKEAAEPIGKAYESYTKIEEGDELLDELAVIPRLSAIIAYNNEDYEHAKTYAEVYLNQKPEDENIKKLMDAIDKKLSGPSPQELYNLAIEQINANNDAGAAKILQQAIKADPNYGLAYFQLGKIKTRDFEFEDAVKNFKTFVKLDPKNKLAAEAKELIVTLSE